MSYSGKDGEFHKRSQMFLYLLLQVKKVHFWIPHTKVNSFPFSQSGSHHGFKAMERGGLSASTQGPWLLLDPP